jgi:putative nucleotidyltransferase with HDIG domain
MRYLPHVLAATFLVAVLPVLSVYAIQSTGRLQSPVVSVALAMLLSVAAAQACAAYWVRRPGSNDIVFGDLMVWGWVRRLRTERRLARATELLGLDGRSRRRGGERLGPERRAEVLQELAAALEARDPYTHGHTRRVTRHSHMIANEMGLTSEQVATIRTAAAVHDVGKISVPRDVLNKPGKLTDDEFRVMKAHAQDGAEMLSRSGDPEICAMVRHHHEQLDGSGYPDGLKGVEIPLGARIIAVADTFDAMTSSRPYRSARQHKEAIEVLKKSAGSQLDPDAVKAFLSYYSGKKAVAWWGLLAGAPERLLSWAGSALQGAAAPIAKGAAVVGATAALGGSMVNPVESRDTGTAVAATKSATGATGYHGDMRRSLESRPSDQGAGKKRSGDRRQPAGRGSQGSSEPGPGPTSTPATDPGSGADSGSGPGSGTVPGPGRVSDAQPSGGPREEPAQREPDREPVVDPKPILEPVLQPVLKPKPEVPALPVPLEPPLPLPKLRLPGR